MEMNQGKKWRYKFGGVLASFALMIATISANTACMYIAHQPKLPEDAKKLRKF